MAQGLRTGQSGILVFMVDDISNPFFAQLVRIFEDLADEQGYRVLFCSTNNNDTKSGELIDLFNERSVDGFIIIPSPAIQPKIKALQGQNIPVVPVDRYYEGLGIDYVGIDNEAVSFQGITHLIHNGYKMPVLISVEVHQTQMLSRVRGYERAAETYGFDKNILLLPYLQKSEAEREKLIRDFLEDTTNYLAKTGLEVLKNASGNALKMPGLITFDDSNLFTVSTPTITAICQPLQEIATAAMRIMIGHLKNQNVTTVYETIVLPTGITERESTRPV